MLLMVSCKSDTHKATAEIQITRTSSSLPDNYISNLYTYYSENPILQTDKEENLIIDYIISNDQEFKRLPSGLYFSIIKEGEGPLYNYGQKCTADYSGYFLDGHVFDSSYSRNKAMVFKIGQMNQAWNEILMHVNPGTNLKIIVPSRLAYGEKGFPGYVDPNTVIAFDIVTIPD